MIYKKKKLIFFLFLFLITIQVAEGQEINKIRNAIYLNFIRFSSLQIEENNFLSTLENIQEKKLVEREYEPFFQQMSSFPDCLKNISLTKIDSIKLKSEGIVYNYQINNEFDCYSNHYKKLDLLCEVRKLLPENQSFITEGVIFPNVIFTQGLVFWDFTTKQISFVSGYLHKSKISNFYSTENISKNQLIEIINLRYSNYLPKNIIIVANKKMKKVRFQSQYSTLENIYFSVEFKNNFETENFSFEKKER